MLGADSNPMDITFPERRQTNIDMLMEYLVIGIICAVLAGIVWHFSRFLGALLFLPLLFIFGMDIACSLSNRWRELQWARAYRRQVRPSKIAELIAADPGRYVFHARFFRQISRGQSVPLCIIEDTETKELIPVFPSSWRAVHACRKAGLRELKH